MDYEGGIIIIIIIMITIIIIVIVIFLIIIAIIINIIIIIVIHTLWYFVSIYIHDGWMMDEYCLTTHRHNLGHSVSFLYLC